MLVRTQAGKLKSPQLFLGFPSGAGGKECACPYKRSKFDPCVAKIPWRREQLPTPVFLPGESHGQRSTVGYSPCGLNKLGTDATNAFTSFSRISLCNDYSESWKKGTQSKEWGLLLLQQKIISQ